MSKDVYILGIESSCDETAAAVVKNGILFPHRLLSIENLAVLYRR